MMGILLIGKWPNADPPAWEAGEARPWPTAAQRRAEAQGVGQPAAAAVGASGSITGPAEPAQPGSRRAARKRRRKGRGGRS
jgi:hypothetical protein